MTFLPKNFKSFAFLPLAVTVIAGIILTITHDGSKYKSEWFANDGFGLSVFLSIFVFAFISLLSSPVFLSSSSSLNRNAFLGFICWTLAPAVICLYIAYQEISNFMQQKDFYGNRLLDGYILSAAILHLTFVLAGFVYLRRQIKNMEKKNEG